MKAIRNIEPSMGDLFDAMSVREPGKSGR